MSSIPVLDDDQRARFESSGFVVLRGAFDPDALGAEVDAALDAGVRDPGAFNEGPGNRFQYVPMMTSETPRSLALLRALAAPARQLLGSETVPTRAKGTRYAGSTSWHRDSESSVASIGFLGYLEPLTETAGALQVVEASHRPPYPPAEVLDPDSVTSDAGTIDRPVVAVTTVPGDLIVFDEHLLHSSVGGDLRRQWRVDFVARPATHEMETATRSYFAHLYTPGWDGGYDVDRFPSYDADWQASTDPWTSTLASLGVYEMAARQEAAVRSAGR